MAYNTHEEALQARLTSPLYPEHYLTQEQIEAGVKYCPEYHKWPLVWHSTPENHAFHDGTLITKEQLAALNKALASATEHTFKGEVFAPSKWIYPAWEVYAVQQGSSYTATPQPWRGVPHANDVLWDEPRKRFVLYFNDTVYTKWGNSHLWMDENGKPVMGTLHVRMPKWVKESWTGATVGARWKPQERPQSLIWNGTEFTDAFNGITDFFQAVKKCIAATNKLRLAPGELYYGMMSSKCNSAGNPTDRIALAPNADIDGQGGGLFIRKDNAVPDGSTEIFHVSGTADRPASNVSIHDITIASIQDHYGWGISFKTIPRLSVADSGVRFLHAQYNVTDLTVENVRTYNLRSDFEAESTEGKENKRMVFRNIVSRNVGDNVLGKVSCCIFDNYDVTQDGHAGGGGHLIYFQGSNFGVTFRNCRFVQLERYRQPMLDFNGASKVAANTDSEIEFYNCYIEGAKLFFSGMIHDNNYARFRWMRFFDSVLFVKYRTYGGTHTVVNNSRSDGKFTNWQFEHCTIACPEVFMTFGHRYYFNDKQLIVKDCSLHRYKGGETNMASYPAFFAGFNGKFISERNYVELAASEGVTTTWTPKRYINDDATQYVVEARSGAITTTTNIHRHAVPTGSETMERVNKAALGIEGLRGEYSELPQSAADGTLFYDLTNNRPLWAYNEITTDNNTSGSIRTTKKLTWYDKDGQAVADIDKVLGDVNGDGKVTITDAEIIAKAVANGSNDAQYDINKDGKVTAEDANIVINQALGQQQS